jgi:hypothetical protein
MTRGSSLRTRWCRYLTSVFKAVYQAEPETEEQVGCSAKELVEVTAEYVEGSGNKASKLSILTAVLE